MFLTCFSIYFVSVSRVISGTERGMLMNRGTVVEQSRTINFLQQRKEAMHTWWEYAVGIKQQTLPKTPTLAVNTVFFY